MKFNWEKLTEKQEIATVQSLQALRAFQLKEALSQTDYDIQQKKLGTCVLMTDMLVAIGAETKESAEKMFPEVNFS